MNRPRSIRWKLTLWYVGLLAAILCSFSVALYIGTAGSLLQEVDKTLILQADGTAGTLFAFWEAEPSGTGNWQSSPSATFFGDVEKGTLPDLVKRWADKTGYLELGRSIQVRDRYGQPLAASRGLQGQELHLSKKTLEQLRDGHPHYATFSHPRPRLRILTYPVVDSGRLLFLVQTAAPLTEMDLSLRRLRWLLLFLTPLTLGIASVVGWFLASTALQPVGRMTAQAQQISMEALDRRVDVPSTGDELEQLAVTFNHMLTRLETSFRRLRQFSAAASHELRTPLTVMRGELEVALRKPRDSQEYRRVLNTHLETVTELSHIVEELLTLARGEAAEGTLEWHPVDLSALVLRVCQTWGKVAQKSQVGLKTYAEEPVWVRGEKRLLERLAANLIDNAIRHTPASGEVSVRTDHWKNRAYLMVQDMGPGIPLEELPQIFDRFIKRQAVHRDTHSTGLGLGLCRWISEIHKGHIEVASPPGQGATFTVWLPQTLPPG